MPETLQDFNRATYNTVRRPLKPWKVFYLRPCSRLPARFILLVCAAQRIGIGPCVQNILLTLSQLGADHLLLDFYLVPPFGYGWFPPAVMLGAIYLTPSPNTLPHINSAHLAYQVIAGEPSLPVPLPQSICL